MNELVGPLLDLGNIIFFLASLGQTIRAYKERKNLSALSTTMLLGYILATIVFIIVGYLTNAYGTIMLGSFNIIFWCLELYWKRKYHEEED